MAAVIIRATAAAIGERFHRGDATSSTFVYFYVGRGTGAGLIIDGAPFKGAFGNAGEMGLLPIFGLDGSPVWPEQKTLDVLSQGGMARACDMAEDAVDADEVIRLHQLRDHRLMEWLKSASDTLRDLTAVFEVLFDPEFIAVGGGLPRQIIQTLVDMAYPLRPTPARTSARSRAPATSTRSLGIFSVTGLRRVARPPARMATGSAVGSAFRRRGARGPRAQYAVSSGSFSKTLRSPSPQPRRSLLK